MPSPESNSNSSPNSISNPAAIRESAPYGHACAGCAKAKCRCIGRGPGTSCERCHRLRRECQPSAVARKRVARRPAPTNKTARLEEKLDDLVTLLKTQAAVQPTNGTSTSRASLEGVQNEQWAPEPVPAPLPIPAGSGDVDIRHPFSHLDHCNTTAHSLQKTPQCYGIPSSASSVSATPHSLNSAPFLEPSLALAEEYLKTFRDYHLQILPFIYFPPGVTAAQVQHERPFLWLNIRTICCKSLPEKRRLEKYIRSVLAQRMLVDLERSLDLLLGLIAYIAWYLLAMDEIGAKKILCAYSGLAVSLVIDLRLDRAGQENPCQETESYQAFRNPIKQFIPVTYRTNEERRALLAAYYICSTVTSFLRSQPLQWTPHMEDCLKHLSEEKEVPGDEILVAMARISRVMDDLSSLAFARLLQFEVSNVALPSPILFVKGLISKLDLIKRDLRPGLLENMVVQANFSNAYMLINKLPLYSSNSLSTVFEMADVGRTECVYGCLQAIETGLQAWFSFSPTEMFGLTMPMILYFGRYTHTLYRLSMTEDVAWDRSVVKKAVDVVQVLDRTAELCGSVPQAVGLQTDGSDFFSKSATTMRNAVPVWRRSFEEFDAAVAMNAGVQGTVEGGEVDATGANNYVPMDFTDDHWLSDIFNSWDTF